MAAGTSVGVPMSPAFQAKLRRPATSASAASKRSTA
jgi:hypothetical protein